MGDEVGHVPAHPHPADPRARALQLVRHLRLSCVAPFSTSSRARFSPKSDALVGRGASPVCLLVGIVLLRVLSRDIKRYNALASYDLDLDHGAGDSAVDDDSGWKVLHGEVFRAPKYRMWLCITVGTGAQMAAMCGVTLCALRKISA